MRSGKQIDDNGVMKLDMHNNERTEYKEAVEQIHLLPEEKEEMLEALLEKDGITGSLAQRKKRKMLLLPAYAGGIVAAALLLVFVWPGKGWLSTQNEAGSYENTGAGRQNEVQGDYSLADEAQESEYSETAVNGDAASPVRESAAMENEMEISGNVTDGIDEVNTHGVGTEGFCIIAFANDIVRYDGSNGQDTAKKNNKGQQEQNEETKYTDMGHSGITMKKGECYYTFSETAPGCNVAIQTEDGQNYDDYVVRGYGCHFVKKEGQAVYDTIHVGTDVKFYMELKEESEIDREMSHQIVQQGCNWSDKKIKTVAYIVIEAMEDGAVTESRTVYIGRKGNSYYGMVS